MLEHPKAEIEDIGEGLAWKGKPDFPEPLPKPEGSKFSDESWAALQELELEYWKVRLITAHPGSGKTRYATKLVNWLWQEHNLRCLYLMLSHAAIDEVLGRLEKEGIQWAHWRGHDPNCETRELAELGYPGRGQCTCGREASFESDGPAIAPIDYVIADNQWRTTREIFDFDLWVMDEIDLRRFVGAMCVSASNVETVAEEHPDEPVKILAKALYRLMQTLRPPSKGKPNDRLNEHYLHERLDEQLKHWGANLESLALELKRLNQVHWVTLDSDNPIPNFPPKLVPILLDEAGHYLNGSHFQPRIHLVRHGSEPELRIWWRKELATEDIDPPYGVLAHPQLVVLDATADADLLAEVMDTPINYPFEQPEWPDNVYVHQWVDDLVTMGALGIGYRANLSSPQSTSARERWYGRVEDELHRFPNDFPIGVVTHKAIEAEFSNYLKLRGFTDVRSLHYGDERGSNQLETVRVLVLLGLPIPNREGFQEEAQAFLNYSRSLDFTWEVGEQHLDIRDGLQAAVKVGGHWSGPVASYYRQKCQAGLYQALHRIRPYLDRDYDRHIFIYTNMPIDGRVFSSPDTAGKHQLDC